MNGPCISLIISPPLPPPKGGRPHRVPRRTLCEPRKTRSPSSPPYGGAFIGFLESMNEDTKNHVSSFIGFLESDERV